MLPIAGGLAVLFAVASAQGSTFFWDTSTAANIQATNGTWNFNTNADWSSSAAGSNPLLTWTNNSDTAQFQVSASNTVTIDNTAGQVGAAALNYSTGTAGGFVFTLQGSALQLGTGGINSTMVNQFATITAPLVLTGSQTWSSSSLRNNNNGPVIAVTGAISSLSGTTNLTFDGLGISNPSATGNSGPRASFSLGGINTFSGTTTVKGGAALWLDFTANVGSRLDDSSALILNGGSLILNGGGVGNNIQELVASTTIAAGENTIYAGANGGGGTTNRIQLGDLTHQTGGTLDVTNAVASLASTTTANTDAILGGWATVAGTGWAVGAATAGTNTNITSTSGSTRASSSTWGVTDNVNSNTTEAGIGDKTVNAMKLATASMSLGFSPGATLTITSGGLISGSTGQSITGGTIKPNTASGELFIHNVNAFSVSSAIADNGGTSTILVKDEVGTLTLSGATSYTGGTYINAGTLQITGPSSIRGQVTQQGASTLDVRGGGTIAPGTASAPATMSLGGSLILEDGAVMNLRLGTTQDLISLTNPFATLTGSTSTGGIALNLSDAGGLTTQTYTLMQWQPGTTLTSLDLSDFNVTAPSGATGNLQFGTNSLNFVVTSVSAVPEPASLGMLALGSLGLLLVRRRRM